MLSLYSKEWGITSLYENKPHKHGVDVAKTGLALLFITGSVLGGIS